MGVPDACFPYSAGQGTAPKCPNSCVDGESWASAKVKAKTAYAIKGVVNMQKEIMTNGPIQVAFKVYKSFMSYKSGVYKKHVYEILSEGGHAVKIVGWGTESGTDYWWVANSWEPQNGAWRATSRSAVVMTNVASRQWARPTQACPRFLPKWWCDSFLRRASFVQVLPHAAWPKNAEPVLACRRSPFFF